MQVSIDDLMAEFHAALERHEEMVQAFIEQPSEGANEKMAEAYKQALHIRRELKRHFSKLT